MAATEAGETVLVEQDGCVLVITLNRPESRNAIDARMSNIIGHALEAADHDDAVRSVLITGAGGKAFCAGADVRVLADGGSTIEKSNPEWGFAGIVTHPISKPLVAAVNGAARGGGVEILLSCDLAIADDTASFGMPEVRIGRLAGAGGAFRLPIQVGPKRALEMLLTGDAIGASTALAWGLVNRVVPAGTAATAGLALAQRIGLNAPLSVRATKRIAYRAIANGSDGESALWEASRTEVLAIKQSHDAQEGARAFLERRDPRWQGR
jgi:crotonobetainyl-CoA hydratase